MCEHCITRTFTYSCWLLRDVSDQCEDIGPNIIIIIIITDECRRCGKEPGTLQHITAACEQLASTEYAKRHDGAAEVIHQKLAEAADLIEDKVHNIGTHQLIYWRMTTSSCTRIAA
jgi:hypothetical protein